jgi:endonuclease/exonuclease/phosphatase family metal-dependent hydrolase
MVKQHLLLFLFFSSALAANSQQIHIKAMTYNIRYDNPDDGDNQWNNRKKHLANFINEKSPDFLGIQESLQSQIEVLSDECPLYNWVGVGRDNGNQQGEFAPIFYKKNRFELVETGTFWLSETPEIMGNKGWDAALPRVATWARLKEALTEKSFLVVNTHFDHKGNWARQKSATLILNQIRQLKSPNELVILMGDFNITPHEEAYRILTQNSGFADAKEISQYPPNGPVGTFNDFKAVHGDKRIDYIFTPPLTHVTAYSVFQPKYDGRQLSDHYPVMIELYD